MSELPSKPSSPVGETTLHEAAISNNAALVRSLVSQGVDVNSKDAYNRTPLHYAALFNRENSNLEAIRELLSFGASVEARSDFGNTALHYLARKSDLGTVRLLLEFKADVNVGDNYNEGPLFQAVRNGNHEIVELLVERGSNVNNVSGYDRTTPLHAASRRESLKIIKCFLGNGANPNARDFEGRTPLVYMTHYRQSSEKKLEVLMKYTDVNVLSFRGESVMSCREHYKVVLRHLAKLLALRLPLDPRIMRGISDSAKLSVYFDRCKSELVLAKSTKLNESWITFFNLLVDSGRRLKNYCGNERLVSHVKGGEWKVEFPIYGDVIMKNVEKGVERRKLFDESVILFSDVLPVFSPSHLIVRGIFDCLSTKDLMKFCEQ